jgi:putative endonuclease
VDAGANTGRTGEDAAESVYLLNGYRIVERNWRCRIGELDLVVKRGTTLVFCEVKARRGAAYGGGWQAVTWRKRAKLRALAQAYLSSTTSRYADVRFDVASVEIRSDGRSVDVQVFEDAFR